MKRWWRTCIQLTPAVLLILWGCGPAEPDAATQSGQHRLKVGDLAAPKAHRLPAQVNLQMVVFEVPAENVASLAEVFGILRADPIQFADRATFEANDLRAGFGTRNIWEQLAEKLDDASAEQVYLNALVHFDDRGLDLMTLPLAERRTLSYVQADGKNASVELEPGQLAWSSTARPVPQLRGVADVGFRYVYRRQTDITKARLAQKDRVEERAFDFSVLSVKMSQGDFILLGPTAFHESNDEHELADMPFVVPSHPTGAVRLYLVICMRVGL